MFTDVTVCADLTAKFHDYLMESPDRELSHAINLSILQVTSYRTAWNQGWNVA